MLSPGPLVPRGRLTWRPRPRLRGALRLTWLTLGTLAVVLVCPTCILTASVSSSTIRADGNSNYNTTYHPLTLSDGTVVAGSGNPRDVRTHNPHNHNARSVSTDTMVTSSATATTAATGHYIGAMFEEASYNVCSEALHASLKRTYSDPSAKVTLKKVLMAPFNNVAKALIYLCDAIQHQNITTQVVVGGQHMINTVSITTQFLGIPIIGYNTDRSAVTVKVGTLNYLFTVNHRCRLKSVVCCQRSTQLVCEL